MPYSMYFDDYQSCQTTTMISEMDSNPYSTSGNNGVFPISFLPFSTSDNRQELVFDNVDASSTGNTVNEMTGSIPLYVPSCLPGLETSNYASIAYPVSQIFQEGSIPSSQDTTCESTDDTINEIPQSLDSQSTVLSNVTTKDDPIDSSCDSTTNDVDYEPFDEDSRDKVTSKRRNNWSVEECNLLKRAVEIYGCENRWSDIARYVSTRSVSQCVNKWNNDLSKKHNRWNKEASKRLDAILKRTSDIKEIMKEMPDHTYIQIYQQLQKRNFKTRPWKEEETKLLIQMKKENMTNAKIGRTLGRNSDDVKNMVKKLENRRLL